MAKPPKPVTEMTDAELEAWANEIFDTMAANYRPTGLNQGRHGTRP